MASGCTLHRATLAPDYVKESLSVGEVRYSANRYLKNAWRLQSAYRKMVTIVLLELGKAG